MRLTWVRGVPFAGEALCFSNLFGSHFGGVDVSVLDPPVAVLARRLGGGEVGPHVRFDVVMWDAFTVAVHGSEVALRGGIAPIGCEPVPPHRFRIVLRDASTCVVHEPEVVLR